MIRACILILMVLLSEMKSCHETSENDRMIFIEDYIKAKHQRVIHNQYTTMLIITPNNCPAVVKGLCEYASTHQTKDSVLIILSGIDSSELINYTLNNLIIEEDDELLRSKAGCYLPTLISYDQQGIHFNSIQLQNMDSVFRVVGWAR